MSFAVTARLAAWQTTEYVDAGISGAKDRRPAREQLMADAKRRKVDLVMYWKLDRFGGSPPISSTRFSQSRMPG